MSDDEFRKLARRNRCTMPASSDHDAEAWCEERLFYESVARDETDYSTLARAASRAIEAELGLPGNRAFYLALPPVAFPGVIANLGTRRPQRVGRMDPARHREAVRQRPGIGTGAQLPGSPPLRRVAGLSHRPLPRQGDGAEPADLPLRQPAVRDDLEPGPPRGRRDHRRRGPRRRDRGPATTSRPGCCVTWCRTT